MNGMDPLQRESRSISSPEIEVYPFLKMGTFRAPTEELSALCVLPNNIAYRLAHAISLFNLPKARIRMNRSDPGLRFSHLSKGVPKHGVF